jgi:hypothetical protein
MLAKREIISVYLSFNDFDKQPSFAHNMSYQQGKRVSKEGKKVIDK